MKSTNGFAPDGGLQIVSILIIMERMGEQGFSKRWVIISFVIFILLEVFLGGLLGRWLRGHYTSSILRMKIDTLLMLVSYFLGGLVVGFLSPSVRITEPAVGAFLAVLSTFLFSLFTPVLFFGFSLNRLLLGGGIAFALAFGGAVIGEQWAAKMGNKASRRHFK